jgi:GNAT superfamily N-acetyltransferase
MNDMTKTLAPETEVLAMERIEREAWLDMFAAAPGGALSDKLSERAGAYAGIADRSLPSSEFNRIFGLGVDAPFTEDDLDRAMAWLDTRACRNWSIQLPPLEDAGRIADWMRVRGLEPAGTGWARFFRGPMAIVENPPPTALEIREVTAKTGADFGTAIAAGFSFPPEVRAWFAALAGRPGWRIYVAYSDGTPAACGALYLDLECGWGWLGCDATLPAYRLRGAQTALIHRRVADAMAAGAVALTAETGQPAPGQELNSRSYQNYQRAGFIRAYVRPNFRRVLKG